MAPVLRVRWVQALVLWTTAEPRKGAAKSKNSAQAPFVALCAQRRSAKQVKQSKQFIAQPAMTVNDLIKGLIANDPDRTSIDIPVREFQNQNEVARFAKALSKNKHVDEFVFQFFDRHSDDNENSSLNWDPFLQKLAAHKGLDLVKISGAPSRGLLPLFRESLLSSASKKSVSATFALGPS